MYTVETREVGSKWRTLTYGCGFLADGMNLADALDLARCYRRTCNMTRLVREAKDVRRATRQSKRRPVSSFALLVANATETQRAKLQAARDAGLPFARLARLARLMGIDY